MKKTIETRKDDFKRFILSDYHKLKTEQMEIQDLMKELQDAYENRPVEEKHLSFSHFVKLLELRINNDKSTEAKRETMKNIAEYNEHRKPLEVGEPVWIRTKINGRVERLGGYLKKINKDGTVNVDTGTLKFENIDVKTGGSDFRISRRHIEDLSHIEVPKELQEMDTKLMLRAYKLQAHKLHGYDGYYGYGIVLNGKMYDPIVVKAELNKREDVPNKNIKKQANKSKTIKS